MSLKLIPFKAIVNSGTEESHTALNLVKYRGRGMTVILLLGTNSRTD